MMQRVFGIIGWKNSGKTTLVARLVSEFTRRGLTVSAIKHAHHSFDIDQEGTDTYKLREAGARQVAISSPVRWAFMHELHNDEEPRFEEILSHIGPCDLVLVEGFKNGPFPKIEARSDRSRTQDRIADDDPFIVAMATDKPLEGEVLPIFDVDDISSIADFIADHMALTPQKL